MILEQEGYRVLRFSNAEVMSNVEGVLAVIATNIAHERKGRP